MSAPRIRVDIVLGRFAGYEFSALDGDEEVVGAGARFADIPEAIDSVIKHLATSDSSDAPALLRALATLRAGFAARLSGLS